MYHNLNNDLSDQNSNFDNHKESLLKLVPIADVMLSIDQLFERASCSENEQNLDDATALATR